MMYPQSLHLLQYKGKYLGTSSNVVAFIKPNHARYVASNLKYENITITKTRSTESIFTIKPPKLRKPINKRNLLLKSIDTNTAHYFANVNNIDISLIDEVKYSPETQIMQLSSNYTIDFDVDDNTKRFHLELLYEKPPHEKIDYSEEYNNMLIMSFLEIHDDFDIDL